MDPNILPRDSDRAKLDALRALLLAMEFQPCVTVELFFDGNEEAASIGRNLGNLHPGLPLFRQIFLDLIKRPDVEGVYVFVDRVRELRPTWPLTDLIFVAGRIPLDELKKLVAPLHPGEVSTEFSVPAAIEAKHQCPITGVWWD